MSVPTLGVRLGLAHPSGSRPPQRIESELDKTLETNSKPDGAEVEPIDSDLLNIRSILNLDALELAETAAAAA
ncbi:MAG: hypothetical protein AAGF79_20380, partial [Pseudomonadota bacterium]